MSLNCVGCCPACKPPWIRLVDNIYPPNPQDGAIKNNLSKLTFYALSHPQKLDRIGEYLSKRLSRDLYRNRMMCVSITMEAMDTLLVACHAQTLNLFVESFLKMVQKLLECSDPDMQCRATDSFVKFSNIEEDTPSYHRRYDFFVSQFSAMCHSNHLTAKHRIRTSGLQGLQGVIRKTVCDELQPDIWQQHHMDKIVPSLLYNMHCTTDSDIGVERQQQSSRDANPSSEEEEETPKSMAEKVFRDLICRAAYNNLKSVLRPVLSHMDSHNLWSRTDFPSACFKVIMYSVQAQYGHVVVQMLMSHLDHHSKSPALLKAKITDVLSDTVIISAGGSIGPSVLDVFNSLLRHLKMSVEYNSTSVSETDDNNRFQESIINTIGEFANHLPDFQKIEILMFVINKMPSGQQNERETTNLHLQMILLKTMLKVATKYRTVLMANAFPSGLKNPLLQLSVVDKSSTRIIVQQILHTLIDRHDNTEKLNKIWIPEDVSEMELVLEKPSRQDVHFLKHSGTHVLYHLIENFRLPDNSQDNIESLYTTMCLMLVELGADDTLVEFASFILQLQDVALLDVRLTSLGKAQIHAAVICFANLYAELAEFRSLQSHVNEVIQNRKQSSVYLLPDQAVYSGNAKLQAELDQQLVVPDNCLLEFGKFKVALEGNEIDTSALAKPLSTPEPSDFVNMESDQGSFKDLEVESVESSPALQRNSLVGGSLDGLTFDQVKTVLDTQEDAAAKKAKQLQLLEEFQSAPLETIMNRANSRNELNDRLFEILDDVDDGEDEYVKPVAIDSIKYPAMFVY